MRMVLVKAVTETLAATEYPVSDLGGTPFLPGNDVVLMLCKDGDFAGGNITIRTDNSNTDGAAAWETIRAAADGDLATTQAVELFNCKLGDNIELTAAAVTAGGFSLYALGG